MSSNDKDNFCVVVLSGGDGTRIGGGKPLRLLAGRTLLHHAIASARRWTPDIAVAVRSPGQLPIPAGLPFITDEGEGGPIAALHSALLFAQSRRFKGVLTIPCDIPFAPADLALRLSAVLKAPAGVAVPKSGGKLQSACGLWTSASLALLLSYRAEGGSSLRGFAERIGYVVVDWSIEPFDPFFNINSEADLSQAEAMLKNL